ncbi:MAG: class I SAM-dependent methyltransferase [Planctomycetota bacterium]
MSAAADAIRGAIAEIYERGSIPTRSGGRWDVFPTGTSLEAARALHDLVVDTGATRTIETGLGLGLSAAAIGEAVLRSGDPDARHTIIEPFPHSFDYAGTDLVTRLSETCPMRIFDRSSHVVLPELLSAGERFGFAYIDGSHQFHGALIDLMYCLEMLEPGGLCVIDDHWMPAVMNAVSYVEVNLGVERVATPVKDFLVLRRPDVFPPKRRWDHYEDFVLRTVSSEASCEIGTHTARETA